LAGENGDEVEDDLPKGRDAGAQVENASAVVVEANPGQQQAWERLVDQTLARGFHLKTKAEGWKRLCERLTIPPFTRWESLPGFARRASARTG
jgi:hypothetical protein